MEFSDILGAIGALIFVLALIWGLGMLVQRFNLIPGIVPSRLQNKNKRLQIIDAIALDSKRRVVIVRKDNEEMILLLGPNGDIQLFSDDQIEDNEDKMHSTDQSAD